ncbi:hypothetical protein D3C72_2439740 [compost metagenome]
MKNIFTKNDVNWATAAKATPPQAGRELIEKVATKTSAMSTASALTRMPRILPSLSRASAKRPSLDW